MVSHDEIAEEIAEIKRQLDLILSNLGCMWMFFGLVVIIAALSAAFGG